MTSRDTRPEHERLPAPSREALSAAIKALHAGSGSLKFVEETWDIVPVAESPCRIDCPAGINVKGYLGLIAERRFADALALIREANPFPGICGRVCPHPCEDSCNRADFGGPVAIRALKRFVADYELRHENGRPVAAKPDGPTVAVIGAGPAGLTAAADLARDGFRVTVFEASASPGGMMRWAIPSFRLPRRIIRTEIEAIKAMGVKIKLNSRLGRDFTLAELEKQGFRAVFLAIGAGKSVKLGIPGEKTRGVVDALSFLRKASGGKGKKPGKNVVIIGGGNSAVDAARCAVRLGAESVSVLYRRSQVEMPAAAEEIEEAIKEGVLFQFLVAPIKVIASGGEISKLECIHMQLGRPDESGRARPVPIKGSEFILDADMLIAAIGQQPSLEGVVENPGIEATRWNTIKADEKTLATGIPGVFAGGDAVTGPRTVVEAIGQGHVAARSIRLHVAGKPLLPEKGFKKPVEVEVPNQLISAVRRAKGYHILPERRRRSFKEVEASLTIEDAVAEADRCLRCGPCYECRHCLASCPKEWVVLTSRALSKRLFKQRLRTDAHRRIIGPAQQAGGALYATDSEGREHVVPVEVISILARIDPKLCRSCGECLDACAYDAPAPKGIPAHMHPYSVDWEKCKGCGACLAVCPTGAIKVGFYTPALYSERMRRAIEEATP
jgi:putative selenate reductase YgfK subunit